MVRGAVIGLGNVAVHGHLPGWLRRSDVEIVAVTDTRPERRAACAAQLPRARWYDSAAALLDHEGLDFVDICTPPSSHGPLLLAALERGLHALCEKPLVASLSELTAVCEAAAKRERIVHAVHNWHHAPIARQTEALIRDGEVGRVTRLVWQTLRTQPAAGGDERTGNWRVDPAVAGGGVLTDHGWHVFYLLARWAGTTPTAVSARLETRRHVRWAVEDTATVEVAFPGARADVFLTWAADARRNWAEVTGTTGTLTLDDDTIVLTRPAAGEARRWTCPPPLSDGSYHPDRFDAVAREFVAAVGARAPERSNLAEAALCVALEQAARESSRRGGQPCPVPLPRGVAAGDRTP